jgi:phosphatidylinositol-3-phosphatase
MKKSAAVFFCALALVSTAFAGEGATPAGIPHLDHVFLIVMENHGYGQIITNPNAPFTNQYANYANSATNYFAIGHPSLTNYLEIVGGSNFGVRSDNNTDWHNLTCISNIVAKTVNTDNPPSPNICPISGVGRDAETPVVDSTNETTGFPPENDIDGIQHVSPAFGTAGKTIADQLVAWGHSYKSYQESLPLAGANNVAYSDGFYVDTTDFTQILPTLNPPLSQGDVVHLYASKHNPFVYFQNVQEGTEPGNTLANTVGFEALYGDLGSGNVPSFSFIVPNQCNDQHGRGNAGAFCNFDPSDVGNQAGLNPALIYLGDVTLQRIVTAIKASPAWSNGKNAIVIVWDENDYSLAPNINQVLLTVDTNYGTHGTKSGQFYTHFSLLKSLESGFGLPCLNHACDEKVSVMGDLFK